MPKSWDNLRFLLAIRNHHTMSGAATALGTNVATVSRRIDKLNETLGMPTLLKRSDGWEVNPRLAGILALVEEFESALEREINSLRSGGDAKSRVSIGCPPIISGRVLVPGLRPEHHPPANVAFSFSPRTFEEGMGDYDIVVRVGRPESGRIITRLVGSLPIRVYGHEGAPVSSEWAGLSEQFDRLNWMEMARALFDQPPTIRVSNFDQLLEVVLAMKIPAPLPDIIGAQDPRLFPYPESGVREIDYWIMYHVTRKNDPLIREAAEWIVSCFRRAQSGIESPTVA